MSSPLKKRSKRPLQQSHESSPNTELPYELMVSILARVSRLYYTKLSLVSKRFRSLLASPELYQSRNLLGCTETFLYVCLSFVDFKPRWYTLYRKPSRNSQKNILAPISITNSPPYIVGSDFVAVGYNIYAFGRSTTYRFLDCRTNTWREAPILIYRFLNCRTNTWREAPRLILAHTNSGFDGESYLPGISETPDSLKCVEWYNTMTRTHNRVRPHKRIWQPEYMEGKIFVHQEGQSVAIKTKDLTWEPVGWEFRERLSICTIDGICYHYDWMKRFEWRKSNRSGTVWKTLRGLEELPKFARYSTVKLADYSGKLVVLWDKYVRSSEYTKKMIWCAEISLEVRNSEEIWGKVEWFDAVLSVPKAYNFECVLAATV